MKVISSLVAVALVTVSSLAHSYYFKDGFEGGDTYSTNAEGFSWGGDNSNAIFNSQGMLWKKETGTNSPPLTSYVGGGGWTWAKDSNSDWTPRMGSGSNFLNFIYNSSDAWAERRFKLGSGVPDVWISYWLRVPTNYKMPDYGECGGSSFGNKFFVLYHDDYSSKGYGSMFTFGLKPKSDGSGNGTADLDMNFNPGCHSSTGDRTPNPPCTNDNAGGRTVSNFIVPSKHAGKWMQLVFHAVESTASGVENGKIEMWRKIEGGEYEKVLSRPNIHLNPQGGGWQQGYILGDNGLGICEQTEWLLDDFTVSDKPLMSTVAAPNPPSAVTITSK